MREMYTALRWGRQRGKAWRSALHYMVLSIVSAGLMVPLLWMLSTALKSPREIFMDPPIWIPSVFRWDNFALALRSFPFLLYLRNTVFIVGISLCGGLLSASLVAYGFARLRFRGKTVLFLVLLSTIMIPGQVTMIPTYILFMRLGWVDTYLPLTVPAFFGGGAMSIFLLRQFFMTIPLELSEAAYIDGCGDLDIWWRIMIPLAKPALATLAIFGFMFGWNDFLGPLIYLNHQEKYTLSLGLRMFQQRYTANWSPLMALSLIMMLPSLALFFTMQRYFVEGITITGVKG